MQRVYVTVGSVVVGAFDGTHTRAFHRFIGNIAVGCNPKIKKCPKPGERNRAQSTQRKTRSAAAKTNQVGNYERYPRYLKPGEFKL